MRPAISLALLLVASSLLVDGSLHRVLRQSSEAEQEATTPKINQATTSGSQQIQSPQQQPARLYPDLPQQPNFVPPFNGIGPSQYPASSHHHGQAPFVPFGVQIPLNRLNADQQPAPFGRVLPPVRPMTPAERLQSQSFADGLGHRLLSMIGIEADKSSNNGSARIDDAQNNGQRQQQAKAADPMDDAMRALQNSTILRQLSRGVNSIYGGLSKMYNNTVQEQLDLLQRQFKSATENSTNPWSQRMAEQVPQFFKQMATRVSDAQGQLNKVWQDITQASQGNSSVLNRSANRNSFDQFIASGNDFFNNIGRSLGIGGNPALSPVQAAPGQQQQAQQQPDLGAQLSQFWHSQVQPQIGMVRNQVARVWRDLTSSGAFTPETVIRSRVAQNNQASSQGNQSNLVDDILKEVDMSGSEYTFIEGPRGEQMAPSELNKATTGQEPGIELSPQMRNRLIIMQRELNQLWMGLTNSLQGAINNVRNTVNPQQRAQLAPELGVMASNNRQQSDPAINEIDGKVKDLAKLQRDADLVYDTVQQQQREAMQGQTVGDRFRSFFNNVNVNLSGVNQLPDRIGQSFNRFGVVVNDFWNQIPERWDNFVQNMRPQQQRQQDESRFRMQSTTSTTSTKTTENPNTER